MQLMYHDDDCGELLTDQGECPKCRFHPDMQSTGFVQVSMEEFGAMKLKGRTFLGIGREPL